MEYIATFFSHYGAMHFAKGLQKQHIEHQLMPVPRKVSSSCGTCVRFAAADYTPYLTADVEGVYLLSQDGIQEVFSGL